MTLFDELRTRFPGGVRSAFPERGDHKYLHVSDLAQCPTFVMARILGYPMIPPTPSQMIMWQQGLAMEKSIVWSTREALRDLEVKVETDDLLWLGLSPAGDPIGGKLSSLAYNRGFVTAAVLEDAPKLAEAVPFIGHPDVVLRRGDEGLLLETKSERFTWELRSSGWVAIAPAKPRDKYFVQGPAYAFSLGFDAFAFGIGDRVSGGVEWYPRAGEPYATADHLSPLLPKMAELAGHFRERTIPKPKPPTWGWEAIKTPDGAQLHNIECARCPYAACVKNTNPLRESALEKAT